MQFETLKQRLKNLEVAHICDTSEKTKVFHRSLKPLTSGLKMIGIARTVNCHDDLLEVLKSVQELQPNEVLVIAANGKSKALFGEIITTTVKYKNGAGIISDGACRDIVAIQQLHFPVYVHSYTPQVASKIKKGERQVPVLCGGITVFPGDIIFGDDDGVIAIEPTELITVLPKAESLRDREQNALQRIRSGENFFKQVLKNFDDYYAKISQNQPATLEWEI